MKVWRFALPGILLGGCLAGCSPHAPALSLVGDPIGGCRRAIDAKDWSKLQSTPTEFGLDGIRVNSRSPVVIQHVELMDAVGLTLTNVAFVPGGPVGSGFPYNEGAHASTFPAKWSLRSEMPGAILTRLTATKDQLKQNPSATTWQLVVGVQPTAEEASAVLSASPTQ